MNLYKLCEILVYMDERRDKNVACFWMFMGSLICYILFSWIFSYQNEKGLQ